MRNNCCPQTLAAVCLGAMIATSATAGYCAAPAPQPHQYNVRDFGAVGDGKADDAPGINAAITAAVSSGAPSVVLLPAGNYRLVSRAAGARAYIAITNAKNVSLTGAPGAKLIAADLDTTVIRITQSAGVSVSTLTLDTATFAHSEGRITSVDQQAGTVDVTVSPGFDELDRPDFLKINELFVFTDPATCSWDHSNWPPRILSRDKIGDHAWRMHLSRVAGEYAGKQWLLWHNVYHAWAVNVNHSSDIRVEHLRCESVVNGYEVIANDGDVSFVDCVLGVPKGSGRVFCASGGMMVFFNRGTLTLDHCAFSGIDDDAVNMGTHYQQILARIDDQTCIVDRANADFRTGDEVAIWDWNLHKVRCTAKVVDANPDTPGIRVRFDRPVLIERAGPRSAKVDRKAQITDGADRLVNMNTAGRLIVRNCRMSSIRARCVLVKASNSIIENNVFYSQHMPAILAGPEFYWEEGPNVKNLTIRNNRFENMYVPAVRVGCIASDTSMDNENILIENNDFEVNGPTGVVNARMAGAAICITNTKGAVIHNNRFTRISPTSAPAAPSIIAGRSEDIQCTGNAGAMPEQPVDGTADQLNEEY
ncbi:MAG: glycosyl hydrolase family 28-related protein [Capsulimonadaceae bacterium]|nr:glycosyl hydrolase family 28-related protein [Capsulimonadaceae bacterium]